MGKIEKPKKSKLIISIIANKEIMFENAKSILIDEFGDIDNESDYQSFDYTSYYEKEMGSNLLQKLVSFNKLISPGLLSRIKHKTNKMEMILSFDEIKNNNDNLKNIKNNDIKRKVNLDPGYLTLSKFILASTKNGPARIYLNNGIYAEITLSFIKKSFCAVEWTYKNYQTPEYIYFLNNIRENYKREISVIN